MAPSLGRSLAALSAPPRCAACAGECPPASVVCEGCERELAAAPPLVEPGPPQVGLLIAASRFEGAARDVVHGLKFGRRLALAGVAAEAIARAWPPDLGEGDEGVVVPVPAAPWRWRWRGFDPAEEIAIALARGLRLPLRHCLRRRHGPRQVGRPRRARLGDPPVVGLRGAAPAAALLVDDVCTTGATLSACAAALRSGGARCVTALVFARAR